MLQGFESMIALANASSKRLKKRIALSSKDTFKTKNDLSILVMTAFLQEGTREILRPY